MAKQTLVFTSAKKLSVKDGLLLISDENEEVQLKAFEDIRMIMVDHHSVTLSVPLLNKLADNNIAVVFCNEKHMPNTMLMDLKSNSLQTKYIRGQLEADKPLNKNLWKQIVEIKIKNQSNLLQKLGKGENILKPYYNNVKSGDKTNREGIAAKIYWKYLFGKDFIRDRFGPSPNDLLNYGYTVLRSFVARALMNSGLMPGIGIFHRSYFDAFPLADDMMEPFRPFIDEKIYELFYNGYTNIDNYTKQCIFKIFYTSLTQDLISSASRSLAIAYSGEGYYLHFTELK